jgi:ADP-ribosylglycohydrolase
LWARALLEERPEPWSNATAVMRQYCAERSHWRDELEQHIQPERPPGGNGSGYVVDCLHSARLACAEPTYQGVVRAAIALGHDTDTTATVAGGIAGLRDGLAAIPQRWLSALAGRSLVDPLAARLVARWR